MTVPPAVVVCVFTTLHAEGAYQLSVVVVTPVAASVAVTFSTYDWNVPAGTVTASARTTLTL